MAFSFSNKINDLQPSAIREILKYTADPSMISFSAGNPAPEAFPVAAIQTISQEILQQHPIDALQYGISEGLPSLRESIPLTLLATEHIKQAGDDLIIVSGAQQGVALTCQVLCDPSDVILCEEPSFIGSLNAFKSQGVKPIGIPMEEDGISLEHLEQALKRHPKAKFLYLIPNFQNPTGITMSLQKRQQVLRLAEQYDLPILEDNPYSDLRFAGNHLPSLKSMGEQGNVIYCGSFSKLLSPGLRVGYLVATTAFVQKITICKQVSDVHTASLSQMICDQFLRQSDYHQHIRRLQEIYRTKCSHMLAEIHTAFPANVSVTQPEGGLFLWATLPEHYDVTMSQFAQEALAQGVAIIPGDAFATAGSSEVTRRSFRLNFSMPSSEQVTAGIRILGNLLREYEEQSS